MWTVNGLETLSLAGCSAAVAEEIYSSMVYRKQRHTKLNREIEKQSNDVIAQTVESGYQNISANAKLKKKVRKEKERLARNMYHDLSVQIKSTPVEYTAIIILLIIYNMLSNGRVAAKLPFLPSWMQGENYVGNGYYDLAYLFLYIFCMLLFRCYIEIWLGFRPSKAAVVEWIKALKKMHQRTF